ncbi:uncharacterized protein LOC135691210 [Rhopilema esculentum]|uniref:uncharacterized protein LOC135691210 n=1 Tax=Rhopilema esculentum TaxID=499914 RepID=UPI0031DAEE26
MESLETRQHLMVRRSRSLESQVAELEKRNHRLFTEKKEAEKLYFQSLKNNDKFSKSIQTLDMTLELCKRNQENVESLHMESQSFCSTDVDLMSFEPTVDVDVDVQYCTDEWTDFIGAEATIAENSYENLQ